MVIISLALSAFTWHKKIMDGSWSYLGMLAVALGWGCCALSMVCRLRWGETRRDDAPNLPNEFSGWMMGISSGAPPTRGCKGTMQRRRVLIRDP